MRIPDKHIRLGMLAVSGAAIGLLYLLNPAFHTGINRAVGLLSAMDQVGEIRWIVFWCSAGLLLLLGVSWALIRRCRTGLAQEAMGR